MKAAQAILFDLDGTLTNSAPGIINSLIYAIEQIGKTPPPREGMMRYIGPPMRETLAALIGPERVEEAFAHYIDRYTRRQIGVFENSVYDGVFPMLEALAAKGTPLFVATSKHVKPARMIADHFGLTRYFRTVHGSQDKGHLANKAELIAMILKEEGLDPATTLMVGDRSHDVLGAKKNGVACLGALWGYGSAKELEEAGASQLFETPAALAEALVG